MASDDDGMKARVSIGSTTTIPRLSDADADLASESSFRSDSDCTPGWISPQTAFPPKKAIHFGVALQGRTVKRARKVNKSWSFQALGSALPRPRMVRARPGRAVLFSYPHLKQRNQRPLKSSAIQTRSGKGQSPDSSWDYIPT